MGNGSLSQEEIDILLGGALPKGFDTAMSPQEATISDTELDAIGEVANISMGSAATALSELLGRKVEITTPKVEISGTEQVAEQFKDTALMITVEYTHGVAGFNLLILSQNSAAIIVDLMMGGNGLNPATELSDIQISGIAEAMNQMMGSSATALSSMFDTKIDISPPKIIISNIAEDDRVKEILHSIEPLVRISFRLMVEGVIDSVLVQVIPMSIAKQMVGTFLNTMAAGQTLNPNLNSQPQAGPELPPITPPSEARTSGGINRSTKATQVQPAQFMPVRPSPPKTLPENLELILDVPLQVSVELGKAKKTIREIMNMGPGSVIELDRMAGETVDMIVNGKLIAKCEVVVINETFGIRILEIVQPADRILNIS